MVADRALRLLLVDDDQLARRGFVRFVSRYADVDDADGMATARQLLSARRYDVVLADLHLGDGYGHELLRDLTVPTVRVLISAFPPPSARDGSYDLFLEKPDGVIDFVRLLRSRLPRR